METTTIQLSKEIKTALDKLKLFGRETYNEVLARLLEDIKEINEQTKKDIQKALKEIAQGRYKTHEQLKKEMGF